MRSRPSGPAPSTGHSCGREGVAFALRAVKFLTQGLDFGLERLDRRIRRLDSSGERGILDGAALVLLERKQLGTRGLPRRPSAAARAAACRRPSSAWVAVRRDCAASTWPTRRPCSRSCCETSALCSLISNTSAPGRPKKAYCWFPPWSVRAVCDRGRGLRNGAGGSDR